MPTSEAPIYRDLMRFKPEELTLNAWAVKAGVSRTVWADMRRHGNPSRRTLAKLLSAVGSSIAEFEALRVDTESLAASSTIPKLGDPGGSAWVPARLPALPLIAASLVGELHEAGSEVALIEVWPGQIIGHLFRPPSLASDAQAYAITTVAGSMRPRFRPGRHIAVSPQASVAVGDDVLVLLRTTPDRPGGSLAIIGELVTRSNDSIQLRQFKPDRSFSLGNDEIGAVHKIAGELI